MLELERLQVRVVSGRLGRKEGEKDSSDDASDDSDDDVGVKKRSDEAAKKFKKQKKVKKDRDSDSDDDTEASSKPGLSSSINASLLSAANSERGGTNQLTDANFADRTAQRRNSSFGLSLGLPGGAVVGNNQRESLASANDASTGESSGFGGQSNRPYVGGASASAYEAARADYYRIQSEKKDRGNSAAHRDNTDHKSSGNLVDINAGLNLIGSSSVGSIPQIGLSVNPNQHYEMLKLHHMNLLNEIQETTLMMNLYQQQQLQQQKALQSSEVNMELQQLAERQQLLAMQQFQNSLPFSHGAGNMLGVGVGLGSGFGMSTNPSQFLLHQQQQQFNNGMFGDGMGGNRLTRRLSLEQSEALFTESEIELQEKKLQLMKEELARRRDNRGEGNEGTRNKRIKGENHDHN